MAAVVAPETRAPPAAAGNGATDIAFADLALCAETLRALHEVKGFERATAVQGQTLPHILGGADVLARAKTGSGKTIALLLPAEKLAAGQIDPRGDRISVLILSPTRELATQILDETNALLRFHEGIGAQVVYGGTNVKRDARALREERCDVLVATPGRLIDHLENGDVGRRLEGCHTLVLDEADRLLDMGFKPSVEKILKHVPTKHRQTLLFSATVSAEIKHIARASLRDGHAFVDCVGEEASGTTNAQVSQALLIAPLEEQFAQLKRLVDEHCAVHPGRHKIMVFFTTARARRWRRCWRERDDVIEIHQAEPEPALEGHGFVPQGAVRGDDDQRRHRARCGLRRRHARRSDGCALQPRAVHPPARRTGRAGKSGEGVLVLSREEFFRREGHRGPAALGDQRPRVAGGRARGRRRDGARERQDQGADVQRVAGLLQAVLPEDGPVARRARAHGQLPRHRRAGLRRGARPDEEDRGHDGAQGRPGAEHRRRAA